MLVQLHHEFEDRTTEMVAQKDIETNRDMDEWMADVATRHPLPKGAKWVVHTQESHRFVLTHYNPDPSGCLDVEVCV